MTSSLHPRHSHSIVLFESNTLIFMSKFIRRTENFRLSNRQYAGVLILKGNSAHRKILASRDYRHRSDDFLNLARERPYSSMAEKLPSASTFL